jgi:hypothetical protein
MEYSMQKIIRKGGLALLLGSALASPTASAAAMFTVNDGVNPAVNVTDNGVGDLNAATGAIATTGPIGTWAVNVETGLTKPVLGNASAPEMNVNGIHFASGAGQLTVTFTDSGFGPTSVFGLQFIDSVGGTIQGEGRISFAQYFQIDAGPRQLLKAFGPFSGPSFSASGLSTFVPPSTASYSLIQEVVMQATGTGFNGFSFDFSKQAIIPEIDAAAAAGSVSLVLGVLALLRERRRFATAK